MVAHRKTLSVVVSALALSGVAVLVSSRAASQPSLQFPAEQPVPLSGRVAALEQRAHRLEQRLAAFERVGLRTKSDGSYQITVNGASATIERDGRITLSPKAEAGLPPIAGRLPTPPENCQPPFTIDPAGVRVPKKGCIESSAECDPPFYYDPSGIKRFIPKCL